MSAIPPAAEDRIASLAVSLDPGDRTAFISAATETIEKLGANAYGEGVAHPLLAPLWRQFFHPPSFTAPIEPARVRGDDSDAPAPRRMQSIVFEGRRHRSREALARHLAPRVGKDHAAVAMALRKQNDDADDVLRYYKAKAGG